MACHECCSSRTLDQAARTQRPAFTLIELLVVIAILALLVSLLVPSLRKAKDLARRALCMSNQRSISLAEYLYADENEEYLTAIYPKVGAGGVDAGAWSTITDLEPEYLPVSFKLDPDSSMFQCPAKSPAYGDLVSAQYPNRAYIHQNMALRHYGPWDNKYTGSPLRRPEVARVPAEVLLTVDSKDASFGIFCRPVRNLTILNDVTSQGPRFRHLDSAVGSMLDGHAETFSPTDLYADGQQNLWGYEPWPWGWR